MKDGKLSHSPLGHFLECASRGELAFQRDGGGRPFFPPRVISPGDGSEPSWEISSGAGVIHALTLVRHKGEAPLALAMIDLDEGFRMMSHVVGDNPETLKIGDRVQVAFRPLPEGQPPMPVFTLVENKA